MEIKLEDRIVKIDVQYGKRSKLKITMDYLGFITVKAPKTTSKNEIEAAVKHHGKAILNNLEKLTEARQSLNERGLGTDRKLLYLGQEYAARELVDADGFGEGDLIKSLKKFYMSSCKKIVNERIKIYQKELRVKPKSVEIMESSTKWGTCSSDKKLTFNYRLAMAPVHVIDYVVIHELCHLIHMNHDRSFWRRVGSLMPDYKEKQEFLAWHGNKMNIY